MYYIEQLVMAYGIEQDRIRALLDGFTSLTPARQFSAKKIASKAEGHAIRQAGDMPPYTAKKERRLRRLSFYAFYAGVTYP